MSRLKAAGAVVLGKNALACGFGALSIGSDLAGSLRTPAHFCGIHPHKPTLGLAATRGMVAPPAPALPVDLGIRARPPATPSPRDTSEHDASRDHASIYPPIAGPGCERQAGLCDIDQDHGTLAHAATLTSLNLAHH